VNFYEQTLLDVFRCLAIAATAFAVGWPLGGRRGSAFRTICLLAPLLTPSLLISYATAPIALKLVGWKLTAFYSAVLMLKLSPLAALIRDFLPPPLSAEALHCERLIDGRSSFARAGFAIRAAGPAPWVILGVIFLLAFTDFELASLLSMKTWAVMLFDAHAGGLQIGESLQRVAWPAAIQLAVLILLFLALSLRRIEWRPALHTAGSPSVNVALVVIALLIAGLPIGRIAWLAASGFASLPNQGVFAGDLLASLGFATGAAFGSWLLTRRTPMWCVLPGLLGALVLSLLILAAIQLPGLRWMRDTPLPLLAAQILLIAPMAQLLHTLLRAGDPREALHLARLAGSRRLLWTLALEPRAGALALLFLFAYFEFTAATILAPIGLTPIFARLHNLAHYGQTAVLSASLLAAVIGPALLLALTHGAVRLYARRDVR
jgi:hypothetical protein